MGYKGQLGLYAYYVFVAYLLRAISPPLAQMTAQVRRGRRPRRRCCLLPPAPRRPPQPLPGA
jgi:hypothetical protein